MLRLLDDTSNSGSDAVSNNAEPQFKRQFGFQERNRARLMELARGNAGTLKASPKDEEDTGHDDDDEEEEEERLSDEPRSRTAHSTTVNKKASPRNNVLKPNTSVIPKNPPDQISSKKADREKLIEKAQESLGQVGGEPKDKKQKNNQTASRSKKAFDLAKDVSEDRWKDRKLPSKKSAAKAKSGAKGVSGKAGAVGAAGGTKTKPKLGASMAKNVGTQMLADQADKYFHAGRRIADLLFIIWLIIAVLGLFAMFYGASLGLFMLGLLSIWPKANYRITVLILDFFGVGEAIEVANKFGLIKTHIKLATWQHVVVWALIIIWVTVLLMFTLVTFLAIGWYLCGETGIGSGGVVGTIAENVAKVYDWWNQTSAGTVANEYCKIINSVLPSDSTGVSGQGGDFGGGGSGGGF